MSDAHAGRKRTVAAKNERTEQIRIDAEHRALSRVRGVEVRQIAECTRVSLAALDLNQECGVERVQ